MSDQSIVIARLSKLTNSASDIDITPHPAGKIDRRLAPRRFCDLPAECFTLRHPENVFTITIQDMSLGGIGFVAGHGLGRGETLRVQLRVDGQCLTRMARTKHVRVEADGRHFHGCSLVGGLDAATLDWLLDRPAQG